MKKIIAVLLCVVFVASLGACGKTGERYDYDLSEYITVGNYKNLDVKIYTKTRDQDKQDVIDYYTQYYATSDKTVEAKDGDTVSVSYVCKVDGVEVTSGSASSKYFVIGAGTVPSEIETAAIGMKGGDTALVKVTYPADYASNADLAGKTAAYDITFNYVMVPAEYNDEFVATYFSGYGVSTMAEFDTYMNNNFRLNAIITTIKANPEYKVISYPDKELDEAVEEQYNYEDSAYQSSYGISLKEILEASSMTVEQYKTEIRSSATILNTVEIEMLYYTIIRGEGFTVSEEEATELCNSLINEGLAYYKALYESYGLTGSTLDSYLANVLSALQETYTVEGCKQSLLYDMVEKFLEANQNFIEVDEFDPNATTEEDAE